MLVSSVDTLFGSRFIAPTKLSFTLTLTERTFSQLRTLAALATATFEPWSDTFTQVHALVILTRATAKTQAIFFIKIFLLNDELLILEFKKTRIQKKTVP